jgi:hypothetical protein
VRKAFRNELKPRLKTEIAHAFFGLELRRENCEMFLGRRNSKCQREGRHRGVLMRSSLSSSLLTEEEKRRKDTEQRRVLRIQQVLQPNTTSIFLSLSIFYSPIPLIIHKSQVREQEKQYALKLLAARKKQKSSQQNQILDDIKVHFITSNSFSYSFI